MRDVTARFSKTAFLLCLMGCLFWACDEQSTQPETTANTSATPMTLRLSPLTPAKRPDSVVLVRKSLRVDRAQLSFPGDSSALVTFTAPSDLGADTLHLEVWAGGFVVTNLRYVEQEKRLTFVNKSSTTIASWLVVRLDSVLALRPQTKRDSLTRPMLGLGILQGDTLFKTWTQQLPKGLSVETSNLAALRAVVDIPMELDKAIAQWAATMPRDQAVSQLKTWLKDSVITFTQYKAVLGIKDTAPPPPNDTAADSARILELKPLSAARMPDSATMTYADTLLGMFKPTISGTSATFTYNYSRIHKSVLRIKIWTAGIVTNTVHYQWLAGQYIHNPELADSNAIALWLLKRLDSILILTPTVDHRTTLHSVLGNALAQGDSSSVWKDWRSSLPEGLTAAQADTAAIKASIAKGILLDTTLARLQTTLSRASAIALLDSWRSTNEITAKQYYAALGLKEPPTLTINDLPSQLTLRVGEDTSVNFSAIASDNGIVKTTAPHDTLAPFTWTLSGTGSIRTLKIYPNKSLGGKDSLTIKVESGGTIEYRKIIITVIDSVSDAEGNKYHFRLMPDGKRWMTSNLYTRADSCAGGFLGYFENRTSDCKVYGGLYKWNIAMSLPDSCNFDNSCITNVQLPHQGLCPAGWHIASSMEWRQLFSKTMEAGSEDSTYNLRNTDTAWQIRYNYPSQGYHGSGKYGNFLVPTDQVHNGARALWIGTNYLLPNHLPSYPETTPAELHIDSDGSGSGIISTNFHGTWGMNSVRCLEN